MSPREQTWQERAAIAMGGKDGRPPRGAIPKLALRLGMEVRRVRFWFGGVKSPQAADQLLPKIAAALNVDAYWLSHGGAPGVVPAANPKISQALLERVPEKYQPLVFALADRETADFLLEQLAIYHRVRRPGLERR